MGNPLISVVIPVWNRPEFLKLSVASVLQQTYTNFELIIVDDGSTDNTLEVAYALAAQDKRIIIIEKDHSGATDTFNRGVKEIKGAAFCLLGSDDLWLSTKLEAQVDVFKEKSDHILHAESFRIDVNGNPQKDVYKSTLLNELGGSEPIHFFERHLNYPYACFFGSSLFVPKRVLDKIPNFPDTVGQDYHFVLRAALVSNIPFTLIPKHLIKNRTNPRSTTCENGAYILKEAKEIWVSVLQEREAMKLL